MADVIGKHRPARICASMHFDSILATLTLSFIPLAATRILYGAMKKPTGGVARLQFGLVPGTRVDVSRPALHRS